MVCYMKLYQNAQGLIRNLIKMTFVTTIDNILSIIIGDAQMTFWASQTSSKKVLPVGMTQPLSNHQMIKTRALQRVWVHLWILRST